MKDIVIIGSGGFCKQVIEIVEEINFIKPKYNLLGVIDDNEQKLDTEILGKKVIGDTDYLNNYSKENMVYGVIAIADGKIRKEISGKLLNVKWLNLIHPKAIVSNYSKLGIGNIICAGVV